MLLLGHLDSVLIVLVLKALVLKVSKSILDMDRLREWDDGEGRFAITRKSWERPTRVGKGANEEVFQVEAIKINGIGSASCRVGAKVSLSEANDHKIEDLIWILQALGNDLSPVVPKFLVSVQQLGGRRAFIMKLYYTNLAIFTEKRQNKRKPVSNAICLIASMTRAFAHTARHHVVHRDVKLNNFVRSTPDSAEAVLIDFERSVTDDKDLCQDSITGASGYMSPEAALSAKKGHRSK